QKVGEPVLFTDLGTSNYYVAVLLSRRTPDLKEFLDVYQMVEPRDQQLYTVRLMAERRDTYQKQVLEQLRREASPEGVDADGKWKLPEGLARKQDEGAD